MKPTDEPLPKGKDEKESSAELAPVEEVGGVVESTTEEKHQSSQKVNHQTNKLRIQKLKLQ